MALEGNEGMAPEGTVVPESATIPVPEPGFESAPAPEPGPAPAYTYDPKPSSGPAPEPMYEPASSDGRAGSFKEGLHDVAGKAAEWLDGWFPGHGNTVLFGILGLVLALLIFSIGLWRSFVIAFLVLAGITFGQYLDGDPKILRLIRDLLDKGE